jgi:transcriptional regulator with XRE-family HTH domain
MTLDELGAVVKRPAPYLSLLENGKKQPRLNLVVELATALEVDIGEPVGMPSRSPCSGRRAAPFSSHFIFPRSSRVPSWTTRH